MEELDLSKVDTVTFVFEPVEFLELKAENIKIFGTLSTDEKYEDCGYFSFDNAIIEVYDGYNAYVDSHEMGYVEGTVPLGVARLLKFPDIVNLELKTKEKEIEIYFPCDDNNNQQCTNRLQRTEATDDTVTIRIGKFKEDELTVEELKDLHDYMDNFKPLMDRLKEM